MTNKFDNQIIAREKFKMIKPSQNPVLLSVIGVLLHPLKTSTIASTASIASIFLYFFKRMSSL
jgi:hypothetical protein